MSGLKDIIARRLSPRLSSDADRFNRIRVIAADAYWWLGEFPDATDTIRWLLDGDRDSNRALDEKPVMKLPSGISAFREYLRRRARPAPSTPDAEGKK